MPTKPTISETLEQLVHATRGRASTVKDVFHELGERSYGPFLLIPALLEISPLGAIPVVPTIFASIIAVFSAQMALGFKHIWIPRWIAERPIKGAMIRKSMAKLKPVTKWMDKWSYARLHFFTQGIFIRITAVLCLLLACTVPPLEVIPMASSLPMLAIAMFGLAMMIRDGLLMLIATVITVLTVPLVWTAVSSVLT